VRHRDGIYTYFAAEILNGLPLRTARFLLQTSVLPMIDIEVCNGLLGASDAGSIIEDLRARKLVQVSGEDGSSLGYHPLMREFLLSRLRADSPHRCQELRLRAADLFRRSARWQESVDMLVAAEAWERLGDLLEDVAPGLLRRGMWGPISEWLDRLPDDVLMRRDRLLILRSKLAYHQGDSSSALRLLASRKDVLLTPQGAIVMAAALAFQGQYAEAVRVANQALQLAKRARDTDGVAEARLYLGLAQVRKGSYRSAEKSLRSALRRFLATGDIHGQALASMHLAGIFHFQGHVDGEITFLGKAERLWRALGNAEMLAWALNNLGVSHHQRGNWDEASSSYDDCMEVVRQFGLEIVEAYCVVGMADLFRDRGNAARAERLYERGVALAKKLGDGGLCVCALAGQADLKRLSGALDEAEALASQALVEAEDHQNPREEGMCLAVLGSVYRDQSRLGDSVSVLERACGLLEGAGIRIEAAKASFLLATTLFRRGGRPRALSRLEKAAEAIRDVGHDQFILPLLSRERALIEYGAAKRPRLEQFRRWLAHLSAISPGERADVDGMAAVEVRAFGGFSVSVNGMNVSDLAWETVKAKEMLLLMTCRRGPAQKEEIVEALWPGLTFSKCNSYFHSNLHRIRRVLGRESIIREGSSYSLNKALTVKSDVLEFVEAVELARETVSADSERSAVRAYAGSFAPEVYSDWAADLRCELEQRYMWVLDRLLRRVMKSGDESEVVSLCERILEVDPFHEAAWQEILQYYRDRGLLGISLRLYRRCTDAFVGELGTQIPTAIERAFQPV
jgi:ATP/maltotriose-dependent transcriptional regulator MalT/DNA-binding SARP family transcriptional activator